VSAKAFSAIHTCISTAKDVHAAAELLGSELKNAYARIRKALQ
jgi:hypothetical protein